MNWVGATGSISACEPFRVIIEAALAQGLSAQRIWQDLQEDYCFRYGYDSVKRFVRSIKRRHPEVADVMEHPPALFPEREFRYDREKDCYICPRGLELTFKGTRKQDGRMMKIYQGEDCLDCAFRARCTTHPRGRTISRWEHEEILEAMRQRVRAISLK